MIMDEMEMSTIIDIIFSAHGGCPWCVAALLEKFSRAFPMYIDIIHERFDKQFGGNEWYDVESIWNDAFEKG